MAEYGENIQLDSEFTYQQYAPAIIPQNINISGTAPGGAVTNIDGDSGGGAVGPIILLSGGITGYSFQAVGTSVTMTGNATTILAALGIAKQNVTGAPPTVNDDSGDGYSANSLWTDTAGAPDVYVCSDPALGAAVWTKIAP